MLPEWLAIKPATTRRYDEIRQSMLSSGTCTVCVEAHCPNMSECWSSGTATFMILGDTCTRGCRFCNVKKGATGALVDESEPEKLAGIIKKWKLSYVVLTSVCRDDLADQGASHFAACIEKIRRENPKTVIEVLIPDFKGDVSCLQRIVDARPDVIGHNIETVERLTPTVRDRRASYSQSIDVLRKSKLLDKRIYTKSAMMLGLGETDDEILSAFGDLRKAGVDFLAVGQYLRPSTRNTEVKEYIRPEKFEELRKRAMEFGFLYAASGPFVRSSYKAGEYFVKSLVQR
jgi:lipoic acid synthetase